MIEDKLNRSSYINFIKNLIKNSQNYKRDNENKSYIMAIDSPWGTGKTTLINLLKEDIEKNDDEIKCIVYNAWKNDYCNNAFEPLCYDILNDEIFDINNESEAAQRIIMILPRLVAAFCKNVAVKVGGEIVLSEVAETGKDFENFVFSQPKIFKELKQERKDFEKFSETLMNTSDWLRDNNHKLVIIIDELDRCKPTFAIQTLEIVKHLFSAKNIVFIFSVDIQQLSSSIKCVYGQDMDAQGYLCRFFDYIAKMPNVDVKEYIKNIIENLKLDSEFKENITVFIEQLFIKLALSIRDLNTLLQNYRIMLETGLYDYKLFHAHKIYLFFLALKYKRLNLFNELLIGEESLFSDEIKSELEKLNNSFITDKIIKTALDEVFAKKNIGEKIWTYFTFSFLEQSGKPFVIKKYGANSLITNEGESICFNEEHILSCILYTPDLKKWAEIRTMPYRQYLYKQLENYNFTDFV